MITQLFLGIFLVLSFCGEGIGAASEKKSISQTPPIYQLTTPYGLTIHVIGESHCESLDDLIPPSVRAGMDFFRQNPHAYTETLENLLTALYAKVIEHRVRADDAWAIKRLVAKGGLPLDQATWHVTAERKLLDHTPTLWRNVPSYFELPPFLLLWYLQMKTQIILQTALVAGASKTPGMAPVFKAAQEYGWELKGLETAADRIKFMLAQQGKEDEQQIFEVINSHLKYHYIMANGTIEEKRTVTSMRLHQSKLSVWLAATRVNQTVADWTVARNRHWVCTLAQSLESQYKNALDIEWSVDRRSCTIKPHPSPTDKPTSFRPVIVWVGAGHLVGTEHQNFVFLLQRALRGSTLKKMGDE